MIIANCRSLGIRGKFGTKVVVGLSIVLIHFYSYLKYQLKHNKEKSDVKRSKFAG